MPSFHVDGRISIKLDYDFAMKLAEFIINSRVKDAKLIALAHRLAQIDEDGEETKFVDRNKYVDRKYNYNNSRLPERENVSKDRSFMDESYSEEEGKYSKEGMYSKEENENWEIKRSPPIKLKRNS